MLPKPKFYTWEELDAMPPLARYGAFEAMANWQAQEAERMLRERPEQQKSEQGGEHK